MISVINCVGLKLLLRHLHTRQEHQALDSKNQCGCIMILFVSHVHCRLIAYTMVHLQAILQRVFLCHYSRLHNRRQCLSVSQTRTMLLQCTAIISMNNKTAPHLHPKCLPMCEVLVQDLRYDQSATIDNRPQN